MRCLYCQKELPNPKAKFCNPGEKMKYRRENLKKNRNTIIVTETKKIVTDVTDNRNKKEIIVTEVITVTGDERLKKLVFKKETPIEERIKFYKDLFPEVNWVPNWIRNGFLTKDEALKNAIACVNKNVSVSDLGLGL